MVQSAPQRPMTFPCLHCADSSYCLIQGWRQNGRSSNTFRHKQILKHPPRRHPSPRLTGPHGAVRGERHVLCLACTNHLSWNDIGASTVMSTTETPAASLQMGSKGRLKTGRPIEGTVQDYWTRHLDQRCGYGHGGGGELKTHLACEKELGNSSYVE